MKAAEATEIRLWVMIETGADDETGPVTLRFQANTIKELANLYDQIDEYLMEPAYIEDYGVEMIDPNEQTNNWVTWWSYDYGTDDIETYLERSEEASY